MGKGGKETGGRGQEAGRKGQEAGVRKQGSGGRGQGSGVRGQEQKEIIFMGSPLVGELLQELADLKVEP